MNRYAVYFICSWYRPGECHIHIFANSAEEAVKSVAECVGYSRNKPVAPDEILGVADLDEVVIKAEAAAVLSYFPLLTKESR